MDGIQFDINTNPKPPKDWDERMALTKHQLMKTKDSLANNFGKAGVSIKENGLVAGSVISERAQFAGSVISNKSM